MARPVLRVVGSIAGGAALFVVVLVGNTFRKGSVQLPSRTPGPVAVDPAVAAVHLAGAVRFETTSEPEDPPSTIDAFGDLHGYLAATYPRVHGQLELERVGAAGLLFHWKGADGNRAPYILASHLDVVPGTTDRAAPPWTHGPFAGDVAEGFVWGRGTLDDKGGVIAILEAVEALLVAGFTPARSVYLAFGYDEEVSGRNGAARIAARLAERGVKAAFLLDEGMPIANGLVPGVEGPVALIGIAEKGYATVTLSVDTPGGHSSTPPPETAVSILARAVHRVAERPLPAHMDGVLEAFMRAVAPHMSLPYRALFSNAWVTSPLLRAALSAAPSTNASIRTTTAPTVLRAGDRDNVLAPHAEARINFRVFPGETSATVMNHVRLAIGDDRVKVSVDPLSVSEPGPVARVDSAAYGAIAQALRNVFPAAVVAPALFLGATDGRLYRDVAQDIYRHLPIPMTSRDLERLHGVDERVAVEDFGRAVQFYAELVRVADSMP